MELSPRSPRSMADETEVKVPSRSSNALPHTPKSTKGDNVIEDQDGFDDSPPCAGQKPDCADNEEPIVFTALTDAQLEQLVVYFNGYPRDMFKDALLRLYASCDRKLGEVRADLFVRVSNLDGFPYAGYQMKRRLQMRNGPTLAEKLCLDIHTLLSILKGEGFACPELKELLSVSKRRNSSVFGTQLSAAASQVTSPLDPQEQSSSSSSGDATETPQNSFLYLQKELANIRQTYNDNERLRSSQMSELKDALSSVCQELSGLRSVVHDSLESYQARIDRLESVQASCTSSNKSDIKCLSQDLKTFEYSLGVLTESLNKTLINSAKPQKSKYKTKHTRDVGCQHDSYIHITDDSLVGTDDVTPRHTVVTLDDSESVDDSNACLDPNRQSGVSVLNQQHVQSSPPSAACYSVDTRAYKDCGIVNAGGKSAYEPGGSLKVSSRERHLVQEVYTQRQNDVACETQDSIIRVPTRPGSQSSHSDVVHSPEYTAIHLPFDNLSVTTPQLHENTPIDINCLADFPSLPKRQSPVKNQQSNYPRPNPQMARCIVDSTCTAHDGARSRQAIAARVNDVVANGNVDVGVNGTHTVTARTDNVIRTGNVGNATGGSYIMAARAGEVNRTGTIKGAGDSRVVGTRANVVARAEIVAQTNVREARSAGVAQTIPTRVTNRKQKKSHENHTQSNNSVDQDVDFLSDYVRKKTKRFYLGGFSSTVTERVIALHIKDRGPKVTKINIFRSISKPPVIRLNVEDDENVSLVTEPDFWPDGIVCQPWVTKPRYRARNNLTGRRDSISDYVYTNQTQRRTDWTGHTSYYGNINSTEQRADWSDPNPYSSLTPSGVD